VVCPAGRFYTFGCISQWFLLHRLIFNLGFCSVPLELLAFLPDDLILYSRLLLSEVQIRYLSSFSWFGIFLFNSFNYSKGVINKQLTKAINSLSHHLPNSFGSYVIGLGVFRALQHTSKYASKGVQLITNRV
jgi:hypothetical protein